VGVSMRLATVMVDVAHLVDPSPPSPLTCPSQSISPSVRLSVRPSVRPPCCLPPSLSDPLHRSPRRRADAKDLGSAAAAAAEILSEAQEVRLAASHRGGGCVRHTEIGRCSCNWREGGGVCACN
jgi:hypothetical protein